MFVKMVRACIQNFFITFRVTIFFFPDVHLLCCVENLQIGFVVLTAVTSVGKVIVIFLQLILFANTAAFICSLLGLVSSYF